MANEVTYFGAIFAGLLSFLSPCVLPLVPPYLAYLGGMTFEQVSGKEQMDRDLYRRVVISSLIFVLGFTTVFVTLGAAASSIGQFVRENQEILSKIGGVIIIIFGLHFIGIFKISLLYREARFHIDQKPAGMLGAYIMGLAFAFGWTPCIGPVLGAILAIASAQDTLSQGVLLLFVYSLGLGIPFIIAAIAIRPFMSFMQKFRRHMRTVEIVMGCFLIITGILFITGTIQEISFWMLEMFPSLQSIG